MKQSTRPSLVVTPHKGIRFAFSQLTMKAVSMDYADKQQVADLRAQLAEFGDLLDEHAHLENEFILKPLEERVPGSAEHDEQDHLALEALQADLLSKLELLIDPALSPSEANTIGYSFFLDLTRLHAAHLEHMLEEEHVTQTLLWDHFNDEEIMALHGQIIRSIPPDKMLAWSKYLLPALNPGERLELMKGIQAGAPAAFFEQLMAIAETVLDAQAFQKLENKLMVASFQY